ncbi:MAG: SRPBCC family protein [Salinisphaeraceae bacterium]|nr:SRPBCC family protein [Salinisphaeraceae bacterium]
MPKQLVKLDAVIHADRNKVYDFLCDHESFGRIWPGKTTRIRDGDEPGLPNGIGSIRRIEVGPISFEETHIQCQRPELIQYRITRGSPIKNHLGTIKLIDEEGSTRIDYEIEFEAKIPCTGGLIARSLKRDWEKGIKPIIQELETS